MTDPLKDIRCFLDAPLEECNAMATGSGKDALVLVIAALGAFLGTWGLLALITWAVS